MQPEVWDYIFLDNKPYPSASGIPEAMLRQMRNEFQYWYPVDLRVSGKDLIPNHLSFFLFNHCAIWPEDRAKWPKGVRVNGHSLLNSEKMSKSTGNFLTLEQAVALYSADGMRFALADAGDGLDDANFAATTADAGVLRLYTWLEYVKDLKAKEESLLSDRTELTFNDRAFENDMNAKVQSTDAFYDRMMYKDALKSGFFELQLCLSRYREFCGTEKMHRGLINRYVRCFFFFFVSFLF